MFSRGFEQSDRIIIEDVDFTDAYIKRRIMQRIKDGEKVSEVWIRRESVLRLLYKKLEER